MRLVYSPTRQSGEEDATAAVPGLSDSGRLITRDWGLFVEGKYNPAGLNSLDGANGLTGTYSIFHAVGGVAYHF